MTGRRHRRAGGIGRPPPRAAYAYQATCNMETYVRMKFVLTIRFPGHPYIFSPTLKFLNAFDNFLVKSETLGGMRVLFNLKKSLK